MKTLHLNLHAKWFDMILSGIKKEEYRSQSDYWFKRLTTFFDVKGLDYEFKHYDTITFRNGYSKNAREFVIELKGITEGLGVSDWGAPKKEHVFILSLGKVISTKNI